MKEPMFLLVGPSRHSLLRNNESSIQGKADIGLTAAVCTLRTT
jgi:hypothetical protein